MKLSISKTLLTEEAELSMIRKHPRPSIPYPTCHHSPARVTRKGHFLKYLFYRHRDSNEEN